MRKTIAVAATAAVAAAAVPAFAATKTVKVDDNFFSPSKTSVRKGTTVKWTWVGDAPHNVVVTRGPQRFRSAIKRSGTFSKRMRRKGRYRIVCTIHSGMTMRLTVR